MKYAAYVRISDKNKQQSETQKEAIKQYADINNLLISSWVTEEVSASKTDVEDRKLSELVNAGYSIIMTDITRLGRRKVFDLLGVIGQITKKGELHLAYTNRVVNSTNADDAETIFTIVGGSFAAVEESKKRAERSRAGNARRKSAGLHIGRPVGAEVRSKLDNYAITIFKLKNDGMSENKICEYLKNKYDVTISRQGLRNWLNKRTMKTTS